MTGARQAPAGEPAPRAAGPDLLAQYRGARKGAVLADRSALGRLAIRGRDALDLLHRLATNGIKTLRPGEGTAAVFVTAKGRIIDLVTFHLLEDRCLCLTGPGRVDAVREWIDRYTFREDVKMDDLGASHGAIGVFGAGAASPIAALVGGEAVRGPLHVPVRVNVGGVGGLLIRTFPLAGEGFHLVAEREALPVLEEAILSRGTGTVRAGDECLDLLRIEAGLPAPGHELTEEFNPWEARLDDAISLTKGCYVGQEVIARLHTYRKVSRLLVRLAIEGRIPPPLRASLVAGGETIGLLTSAATIPGEDRVAGLGYVRGEDAIEGRQMEVARADHSPARAVVLGAAR